MTKKVDAAKAKPAKRKSTKRDIYKRAMLKALSENRFNVAKACKSAGIVRHQHYDLLKSDKEYREAVEACLQKVIDEVEGALISEGIGGNVTALNSFLNARAKDRGYSNNQIVKEIHEKKILPLASGLGKL